MSDLSTIMAALAQLAASSDGKTVNLAIAMPNSTVIQGVHVTYGASSSKNQNSKAEAKKPQQQSKEALAQSLPDKKAESAPESAPDTKPTPEVAPEPTPEVDEIDSLLSDLHID